MSVRARDSNETLGDPSPVATGVAGRPGSRSPSVIARGPGLGIDGRRRRAAKTPRLPGFHVVKTPGAIAPAMYKTVVCSPAGHGLVVEDQR